MLTSMCRDTYGYFNASVFQLWTCSLCYSYLFQNTHILVPNWNKAHPRLIHNVSAITNKENVFVPDINDVAAISGICSYLDSTNCERWKACCRSASNCCQKQQKLTTSEAQCPSTWDGFGCVEGTKPGTTVSFTCPDFLEYGFSSGNAKKTCTENGTWWVDPMTNREWTDYTPCLNLEVYKSLVFIGITCSSISLILLVPAFIAFLSFRQLKSQHRIRLHACLFLSFIMTCTVTILWDWLIYNDRLNNPASTTRMHQNTIFCRILYALTRYCRTCNFFWMLCEGFYLHRLLLQAFKIPKSLKWYYVVGWGGSVLPILVYSIIRLDIADNDCWVKHLGAFEWILYIPNLTCILLNLVFLCSILRILLTRLHSHPNEPSNYRRGLKATSLLVPLFGIQLFFITYRPPTDHQYRLVYEIVSKIIIDSQGAVISLIFFYMNTEVHCSIRHCLRGLELNFPCSTTNESPQNTLRTQMSSIRSGSRSSFIYTRPREKKSIHSNGMVKEYIFR